MGSVPSRFDWIEEPPKHANGVLASGQALCELNFLLRCLESFVESVNQ